MANTEIPMGRHAVRAWKRLDADVRKEAWRRARQGLGHPDPAVAALAVGRARYTLSLSFSVRYWGLIFVVITGVAIGLLAVLDRLVRVSPVLYMVIIVVSLINGVMRYAEARRNAEQMEEANMTTLRTGYTEHGSQD